MHAILVIVAFVLFWVPVVVFAGLADEVHEREPLTIDAVGLGTLHAAQSPVLTNVFLFITALGEPLVVAGASLIALSVLIARKQRRAALLLVAGVGGAVLANLLLKLVFSRSRPTEFAALLTETSYSFPSGHSMVSAALAGVVILLAWRTRLRVPAIVLGIAGALAIGLSRVYLGVHYPSDVIAGWSLGLVWAVIVGSIILNLPFPLGRGLTHLLHRTKRG